jgi:hypothetical protein
MRSAESVRLTFRLGLRSSRASDRAGRLPRVTRLLALAIKLDEQVRCHSIKDYAQLARVGGVSRARITQMMNLLNLAPDLQEQILFFPRVYSGPDPITERDLRGLCTLRQWSDQHLLWNRILANRSSRIGQRG